MEMFPLSWVMGSVMSPAIGSVAFVVKVSGSDLVVFLKDSDYDCCAYSPYGDWDFVWSPSSVDLVFVNDLRARHDEEGNSGVCTFPSCTSAGKHREELKLISVVADRDL